MGKHFEDVAFEVEKKEGEFYVSKTNSELKSKPLSEIDFYKKSFPVKEDLIIQMKFQLTCFQNFSKQNLIQSNPLKKLWYSK